MGIGASECERSDSLATRRRCRYAARGRPRQQGRTGMGRGRRGHGGGLPLSVVDVAAADSPRPASSFPTNSQTGAEGGGPLRA